MEIKIKWIKRKQMTHENTYRDDIIHVSTICMTRNEIKEKWDFPTIDFQY